MTNHGTRTAAAWFAAGSAFGTRTAGDAPRWSRCVEHRGKDVEPFAAAHFAEEHRRILIVGGAGFDPRSIVVTRLLASVAANPLAGLYLRERRPHPNPALSARAEMNAARLRQLASEAHLVDVEVFDHDAVVVGRRVIEAVEQVDLSQFTDVVVDFSALSIGSSFPIARLLLERIERMALSSAATVNLHAMVTSSPTLDDNIVPSPSSSVQPIHGFRGRLGIDETSRAAKLWVPQLRFNLRPILDQLYDDLKPHDVVPVLPFPASDPRLGDRLIEHYADEFDNRWSVDARSIVYADESSPLDFYRTILRIDDGRQPVFASTGGSLLVLSPIGSKVLALGAMMASTERDLPVIYVEALSYTTAEVGPNLDASYSYDDLVHVWLLGEAYPPSVAGTVA